MIMKGVCVPCFFTRFWEQFLVPKMILVLDENVIKMTKCLIIFYFYLFVLLKMLIGVLNVSGFLNVP